MSDEKTWALRANVGSAPRRRTSDLRARLVRLFELLYAWHQHARARRQLLSLSDRALKDIGISRATAEEAANEPFWTRRL